MKSNLTPSAMFLALAFGSVLGIGGCSDQGRNTTKLQYMPDMADSPAVKSQESYLNPPEHSVTVNAILYPDDRKVAEEELRNPFAEGAAAGGQDFLAQGKKLYDTYCTVCHGADGKGKGTLGAAYPLPVPDLTTPAYRARKDGFYFAQISLGGGNMPAYGHATSPHERWWIISYLRTLQQPEGAAPTPPPPGGQPGQQPGQTQP